MLQLATSLGCRPSTYSLAVGEDGQKYCPVQQADLVIEKAGTRRSCGLACVNTGSCLSYTYYENTTRCEIYTKIVPPSGVYENIDNCWNYVVSILIEKILNSDLSDFVLVHNCFTHLVLMKQ